jgi:cell wall-associated NlpC family hydrolase
MVTQLLFGEHFKIISEKEEWLQIETAYDRYSCWISNKQFLPIRKSTFDELEKNGQPLSSEPVQLIRHISSGVFFPIVLGSTLPFLKGKKIPVENQEYEFSGESVLPENKTTDRGKITKTTQSFLNAPYLWGGRSLFGIDCSGFTQMVFKLNGLKLPRDAYQQAELGEPLSFVEEAQAGDLAFFDNEEGRITHVGIILSDNKIIHASGRVKIDRFDHYGIFNSDTKKYSHNLRVIKRVI